MTVVVGYIPTPEGRAALDLAVVEARLRRAPLVIVNVHRDDALSDLRLATDESLAALQQEIASSGVAVDVVSSHTTNASHAVVDIADGRDAQLVVIGLRHRSAVGKLLMGSTAMEILMNAPCP